MHRTRRYGSHRKLNLVSLKRDEVFHRTVALSFSRTAILLDLHLVDGNETFWKRPPYFLIGLDASLVSSNKLGTRDLDIKEDSEDITLF